MKWQGSDVARIVAATLLGACAILCVWRGDMAAGFAFASAIAPGVLHLPGASSSSDKGKDGAS